MQKNFICENCNYVVQRTGNFGTKNRNHCPKCLFSKHADEKSPGDRKSTCMGLMKPIGIAFKKSKTDKYGNDKIGEVMIVHKCKNCGKIVKNRIAGDDENKKIVELCKTEEEKKEVEKQIYGISKN
jgi:hypothetical protein